MDTGNYIKWYDIVCYREYGHFIKPKIWYYLFLPLYHFFSWFNGLFGYKLLNGNDDFFRAMGWVRTLLKLR